MLTTNDFTRELTELCRKHAVGIEGGAVWPMDMAWDGPDADQRAEYSIDPDGRLVRGFDCAAPLATSQQPTNRLLGEYVDLVTRHGRDSSEAREFLDAHRARGELLELAKLSDRLRDAIFSPPRDATENGEAEE